MNIKDIYKNKIGRPSNKVLRIRKLIIITSILIIILLIILSFIYFNKKSINSNNKNINNNYSEKIIFNEFNINKEKKYEIKANIKNINKKTYYKLYIYNNNNDEYINNDTCKLLDKNVIKTYKININKKNPYYKAVIKVYNSNDNCTRDIDGKSTEGVIAKKEKIYKLNNITNTYTNEKKYKNYIKLKNNQERNLKVIINNTTNNDYFYKIFEFNTINTNGVPDTISECSKVKGANIINRKIILSNSNKEYSIKVKLYKTKNSCILDKNSTKTTDVLDSTISQYKLIK